MLPYKAIKTYENALFNDFEKRMSSTLKPHCGRPGRFYDIIKAFMWSLYTNGIQPYKLEPDPYPIKLEPQVL